MQGSPAHGEAERAGETTPLVSAGRLMREDLPLAGLFFSRVPA